MNYDGAVRPEDVLSDAANSAEIGGMEVRKGTIAAFIANTNLLESLAQDDPAREPIVAQLRTLAPALRALGLLDVFAPRSAAIAAIIDEG